MFYCIPFLRITIYLLFFCFFISIQTTNAQQTTWNIGHRGAAGLAPENTLAAIQMALNLGIDGIEVDIQPTKDHKLILWHDNTLNRVMGIEGVVSDCTALSLTSLPLKTRNSTQLYFAPLFKDALQQINGKSHLFIELKKNNIPAVEFIKILKSELQSIQQAEKWCTIITFDDDLLFLISRELPQFRCIKLIVGKAWILPLYVDNKLRWGNPFKKYEFCGAIDMNYKFIGKYTLQQLSKREMLCYTWTVNEPKKMKKLIKMKIAGITTNFPDKLNELLMD